jgi:parallel beta-helix repeat protein
MNHRATTGIPTMVTVAVALLALPAAAAPPATQLPTRMHEPAEEAIRVRVGHADEPATGPPPDFIGRDGRVIQAALDFAARFDAGSARPLVEVGPGRYPLRDSIHLRGGVELRGTPGKTILALRPAVTSRLAADGDYGEEQITLAEPEGFTVGDGVLVEADNVKYFHATVARIIGRSGSTFVLDRPLRSDCMVNRNARATTVFPGISGCDLERAGVEGFVIDGGGRGGLPIEGCRGAGIYLLRAHGTRIAGCEIRDFPGDGLSYQQSNDVTVRDTIAVGNAGHGFHPGSGSQRPVMTGCRAEDNGLDGMFICWRVKQGSFEGNAFSGNARNGISIGHKDTDNLIAGNTIRRNGAEGILFRDELPAMAAHRNRVLDNTIEDNQGAGIRIRGATSGNEIRGNTIRDTRVGDTRVGDDRRQTVDVAVEPPAAGNIVDGNTDQEPREEAR